MRPRVRSARSPTPAVRASHWLSKLRAVKSEGEMNKRLISGRLRGTIGTSMSLVLLVMLLASSISVLPGIVTAQETAEVSPTATSIPELAPGSGDVEQQAEIATSEPTIEPTAEPILSATKKSDEITPSETPTLPPTSEATTDVTPTETPVTASTEQPSSDATAEGEGVG